MSSVYHRGVTRSLITGGHPNLDALGHAGPGDLLHPPQELR